MKEGGAGKEVERKGKGEWIDGWNNVDRFRKMLFEALPSVYFTCLSSVCLRIYYLFLETQYVAQSILTTHSSHSSTYPRPALSVSL